MKILLYSFAPILYGRGAVAEGNSSRIEAELKGKTLLIYWHFLRQGDAYIGVREVQRALNFSSSSVASHHLEKLRRLGLLEKNNLGELDWLGR